MGHNQIPEKHAIQQANAYAPESGIYVSKAIGTVAALRAMLDEAFMDT